MRRKQRVRSYTSLQAIFQILSRDSIWIVRGRFESNRKIIIHGIEKHLSTISFDQSICGSGLTST